VRPCRSPTTCPDLFPDGIWFIELAPLTEADAVNHAVAAALSVGRSEGLPLLESIVTLLEGRRVLLVLDNCEHVIDAASEIVDRVRRATASVSVLATSRQPLGLAGERIWDVGALDAEVEGPELFCQRAEAASRSFARADDNALIADICRQLDGVPLAIELAASRVRSMSLAQLSRGLDDRFRLLRSSGRGAAERHQTLHATVEWSYRLLSDAERLIFDRLSVFAGSFDLTAAEAVCGTEPLDTLDVVDLLSSLVDKSLMLLDATGIDARYRLLETLRQFGQRRVIDQGAGVQLRNRHLVHFAEVARTAQQRFEGSANAIGRATYERDWDNLRIALEWAIETGAADVAGQLVKDSFFFAWWTSRA
jgi:predicted ATPase